MLKRILMNASLTLALAASFAAVGFGQTATQQTTPTERPSDRHSRREDRMEKHEGWRGEGMHEGHGMIGQRALRQLNLTDAQQQQLRAIEERYAQNFKPQREELRQLFQARQQGTLTPEQEARAKTLREELRASGEKMRGEILGILTPEQREQLKQMRQEMREKREERRGHPDTNTTSTPPPVN